MSQVSAEITADVSGYRKALKEANDSLKVFTNQESVTAQTMRKVYDVTQDQVKIFQKSIQTMEKATNGSKSNKQAASALAKEIEKLKQQWNNLSDTAKKSNFGKNMSNAIREAEARMKVLQSNVNSTSKVMASSSMSAKGFNGAFGEMASTLSRFAAPAAVVSGAFKIMKDAMLSSEEGIDNWNSKIQSAETMYSRFVAAIGRGDFKKAFSYEGLLESWNLGQSAYSKSDELDTYQGVNALYKQNLMKKIADLQTKKAEGGAISNAEVEKIKKEGGDYYRRLKDKVRQAALAEFKKSWNSNMNFDDQRVQNMLSQISQGNVNVVDILNGSSYNGGQARQLGAKISKLKQEKSKWASDNALNSNISTADFNKKMAEYDRLIEDLEAQSNALHETNLNNDVAKELANNEVALRKYIEMIANLVQEETEWERTEKRLATLSKSEKKDKVDAPIKGSVAYYEDLIKKENEKIKGSVDAGTIATIKEQIAEYQKKIDELLGNTPKYAFKYQFTQYKPTNEKATKTTAAVQYDPASHLSAIQSETDAVSELSTAWLEVGDAMKSGDPSTILSGISNGIQQTVGNVMRLAEASQSAAKMQQAASLATMGASEGEALGKGTASASGLPFPYNLAAIASVVATIVATFASFASYSKPKKFNRGGVISSPTLAMVGEYSGSSNNPEIVAPLDRLKGMLADNTQSVGGNVRFQIEGRTLVGVLNRESNLNSRR